MRFFWGGETPPGMAGGGGSAGGVRDIHEVDSDESDDITLLASQTGDGWNNGTSGDPITLRLPASAGLATGTSYRFAVTAAQNIVVQANTSQVIRVGASASTSGGTFTSSTVGSVLLLEYERANLWTGILSGTWTAA